MTREIIRSKDSVTARVSHSNQVVEAKFLSPRIKYIPKKIWKTLEDDMQYWIERNEHNG